MRRNHPEQIAERFLQEQGIDKPPVSVERLARDLGIQVLYEPFEGEVSGMLVQEQENGPPIIVVNSLNVPVRQRFTVAHELGHHLLHGSGVYVDRPLAVTFRDPRSGLAIDPEEIAANQFAASILMPRRWVIRDVDRVLERQRGISGEELIERLAKDYRVSRQAMEFRMANLGIWAPL